MRHGHNLSAPPKKLRQSNRSQKMAIQLNNFQQLNKQSFISLDYIQLLRYTKQTNTFFQPQEIIRNMSFQQQKM